GGWMIYLVIAAVLVGALFGNFEITSPAFNLEGMRSLANGQALVPILFITIACGACSGFHGIVGSGTTSKQLAREGDATLVGYGGMLLEAVVAVLAVVTVMILAPGAGADAEPNMVYASGIARALGLLGLDPGLALAFALLAFSTFVYDSLDVCTRLARYVLQELTGWKGTAGAVAATVLSTLMPLAFLMATKEKGYLVAWPVFGTANQLLASLTLLAVAVWLARTGRRSLFAILPMLFMLAMAVWSLVLLVVPFVASLPALLAGEGASPDMVVSGAVGTVLLVMTIWLVVEASRTLRRIRRSTAA
nr:carbon starvation CstA family protein [bacterium]